MTSKRVCLCLAGAVLPACLAAVPALAADEEGWRPWELSATVTERYDNNRDSTKSDKVAVLDSIVAARAALKGSLEQTDYSVFYSPSFRYRDKPRWNQEDSAFYQDAGFDVKHRFSPRLRARARDVFNWTDDPALMQQDYTIRENVTYRMNTATVGGEYEILPGRAVVGVSADHLMKHYLDDDDYADIGDETAFGGGVNAGYMLKSGINVLAEVSVRQTELSTVNSVTDGISRNSTIVFAGLGLEKLFSVWRVRGRAGMDYAKYDNARVDRGSNPGGDIDISYLPTDTTALNLALHYRTLRADISPYTVQQRTSVNLSVDHNFGPLLKCSIYGVYANGDYEADTVALYNGVAVDAGKINGSDTVTAVGGSVGYKITRNFSVDAGAGYEDWQADEFLRTSHNRVTGRLGVTGSF